MAGFVQKLDAVILARLGRPTFSQSDLETLLVRRADTVNLLRSLTTRWLLFGKVQQLPDLTTIQG